MRPRDITDYLSLRRIAHNRGEVLRHRWCRPVHRDLDVELRGAGSLRLRAGSQDYHIFHRVFLADEYRLGRLTPKQWECVVDLGANVGIFAARVMPFARRAIAYEPIRVNFEQLERNLAGYDHVTRVRAAVSDRTGKLRIYAPQDRALSGTFSAHTEAGCAAAPADCEEVEAVSLDAIFEAHGIDHCDLLKIDVEGEEYDILHAAARGTLQRVARIHGECHDVRPEDPRTRIADFSDFLRGHGYRVDVVPHRKKPNHGMFFAYREG